MDLEAAQEKALRLIVVAANKPNTEEGRTAAVLACCLIRDHGLMVVKASEVPASQNLVAKSRRKRRPPNPEQIANGARVAAETIVTTVHAATQIASAVNGFRDILRGR